MKKLITIFTVLSLLLFPILTLGKEKQEKVGECIEGDCENGKGTFNYSDGSKYIGDWKDGWKHGKGKYFFSEGGSFKGRWVNDFYTRGMLITPSGLSYYVD